MKILILIGILFSIDFSNAMPHPQAIDLPAGLKPAKAFGGSEKGIIPGLEETTPSLPANARVPPNLSLRSRMIAALNSPSSENESTQSLTVTLPEETTPKAPLIFQKKKQGKKVTPFYIPRPKTTEIPPPGKDYAVHSLVQTNLIDSKGRLLNGVKAVSINMPATETRSSKPRAFAKRVDDEEAEKIVPITFTKVERNNKSIKI